MLCLSKGETEELLCLYFEFVIGVAKLWIITPASGQQWKFSLVCFNFVCFSADLEAREREAQARDNEEEEIRITRTLEQEVKIHS